MGWGGGAGPGGGGGGGEGGTASLKAGAMCDAMAFDGFRRTWNRPIYFIK